MRATEICEQAAKLVGGERSAVHGDKHANFETIAALWSAYLLRRAECDEVPRPPTDYPLSGWDVANMMELLKIARRLTGVHNIDDYVDAVGYAAIAGELAELEEF